jgi:hypothetical protein
VLFYEIEKTCAVPLYSCTMHSLHTHYAPAIHSLCTHYAPTTHPTTMLVLLDDNLLEWTRGLSLPLNETNKSDTTQQLRQQPFQVGRLV